MVLVLDLNYKLERGIEHKVGFEFWRKKVKAELKIKMDLLLAMVLRRLSIILLEKIRKKIRKVPMICGILLTL